MEFVKFRFLKNENETSEEGYLKRAGVYAEFAKIICISIGYFKFDKQSKTQTFRIKSFYGDDEKELLEESSEVEEMRVVGWVGKISGFQRIDSKEQSR